MRRKHQTGFDSPSDPETRRRCRLLQTISWFELPRAEIRRHVAPIVFTHHQKPSSVRLESLQSVFYLTTWRHRTCRHHPTWRLLVSTNSRCCKETVDQFVLEAVNARFMLMFFIHRLDLVRDKVFMYQHITKHIRLGVHRIND